MWGRVVHHLRIYEAERCNNISLRPRGNEDQNPTALLLNTYIRHGQATFTFGINTTCLPARRSTKTAAIKANLPRWVRMTRPDEQRPTSDCTSLHLTPTTNTTHLNISWNTLKTHFSWLKTYSDTHITLQPTLNALKTHSNTQDPLTMYSNTLQLTQTHSNTRITLQLTLNTFTTYSDTENPL